MRGRIFCGHARLGTLMETIELLIVEFVHQLGQAGSYLYQLRIASGKYLCITTTILHGCVRSDMLSSSTVELLSVSCSLDLVRVFPRVDHS